MEAKMASKQTPFRIKLYIDPDGSLQKSIEVENNHRVPLEGFQLYSRLEPEILKFRQAVHKVVSAYSEPGNPGKHQEERKCRRTK